MAKRGIPILGEFNIHVGAGAAVALILVACGVGLVSLQAAYDDAAPVVAAGDDLTAEVSRVLTRPARAVEAQVERLALMSSAAERVQALERENEELRAWRTLAEQLAERSARYEALLGMPAETFGDAGAPERAIAARLVLDSGGPFRRTLVANAGSDHGVAVGFIALNENGLIGRVVGVGRRSARVMVIDDADARVPVMGLSSRVRAVMVGDAGRRPRLAGQMISVGQPRMEYVVGADSLREGEPIVTSGDGGVFPRGMPVGVARRGADGVWRVSLAVAQAPVDFVRIAPFAPVEPPPEAPPAEVAALPVARPALVRVAETPPPAPRPVTRPAPVRAEPAPTAPQPAAAGVDEEDAPPPAPAPAAADPAPVEQPIPGPPP